MKKISTLLFVLLFPLVLGAGAASPPPLINYQGVLLDGLGNPVNGNVQIAVAVYDNKTSGSLLWQQSVGTVSVYKGLYSLAFGDASLLGVITNDANWLEISVDGDALSPRQRLLPVPYAMRTKTADTVDFALPTTPSGAIAHWFGDIDALPEGWLLCDGKNGTPDLRDRFVYGASASVPPGTTGGANSYPLSTAQLPPHTHTGVASTAGSHTHTASTTAAGAHDHGVSVNWVVHSHSVPQRNYTGTYPKNAFATSGGGAVTSQGTSGSGTHSHGVGHNADGAHTHSLAVNSAGEHSHSLTVGSSGSGQSVDNRPTTLLLAYIIKS